MVRHNEKTLAGRAKMLSGGDTGDRLAEVDDIQTDRQTKQMMIIIIMIG